MLFRTAVVSSDVLSEGVCVFSSFSSGKLSSIPFFAVCLPLSRLQKVDSESTSEGNFSIRNFFSMTSAVLSGRLYAENRKIKKAASDAEQGRGM